MRDECCDWVFKIKNKVETSHNIFLKSLSFIECNKILKPEPVQKYLVRLYVFAVYLRLCELKSRKLMHKPKPASHSPEFLCSIPLLGCSSCRSHCFLCVASLLFSCKRETGTHTSNFVFLVRFRPLDLTIVSGKEGGVGWGRSVGVQ